MRSRPNLSIKDFERAFKAQDKLDFMERMLKYFPGPQQKGEFVERMLVKDTKRRRKEEAPYLQCRQSLSFETNYGHTDTSKAGSQFKASRLSLSNESQPFNASTKEIEDWSQGRKAESSQAMTEEPCDREYSHAETSKDNQSLSSVSFIKTRVISGHTKPTQFGQDQNNATSEDGEAAEVTMLHSGIKGSNKKQEGSEEHPILLEANSSGEDTSSEDEEEDTSSEDGDEVDEPAENSEDDVDAEGEDDVDFDYNEREQVTTYDDFERDKIRGNSISPNADENSSVQLCIVEDKISGQTSPHAPDLLPANKIEMGNKQMLSSPSARRVSPRSTKKRTLGDRIFWADPEFQDQTTSKLNYTWEQVQYMWIKLRPFRRRVNGTDPNLNTALKNFQKDMRRVSDTMEDQDHIDKESISELDNHWHKIQESLDEANGVEYEEEKVNLTLFSNTFRELVRQAEVFHCILEFPDSIDCHKRKRRAARQT